MKRDRLRIVDLRVAVEDKVVLTNLDLRVGEGEIVALVGENGSGKSSLAMTLMGNPTYKVHATKKTIFELEGKNLLEMSCDQRARAGVFNVWQNPISIPGVKVFNLCRSSYESMGRTISSLTDFKHLLEVLAKKVGLTVDHIGRGVNEGFSGGEKKRLEMMQLLLLEPKLVILDEVDSGMDSKGIEVVMTTIDEMKKSGTSFILITHNKKILEEIAVDTVWEMSHGQLRPRI